MAKTIKPENEKVKEKVVCFVIYKVDGRLMIEISDDMADYELYGFLECYMEHLRKDLTELLQPRERDDASLGLM